MTLSSRLRDARTAYLTLFVVMLACHLQFVYTPGDEVLYGSIMSDWSDWGSLFSTLAEHYQIWSGRLLIEALFCIFSMLPPLVWRLLNPVFIALSAWFMGYGLRIEKKAGPSWLLCAFVFLYQWPLLATAGWIVTSIAYLWPLFFGLAALMPLFRLLRQEHTGTLLWVLSFCALVLSTNMEQPALLMPCFLGAGIVFLRMRGMRIHPLLWAQLAVCVAALVFIFTCPGNAMRTEGDITAFYPNFPMLSVLQKAEIGISGAISSKVFGMDSLFYLFCVVLAALVWQKRAPLPVRLLSLIPCLALIPMSLFKYDVAQFVPSWSALTDSYTANGYITLANCGSPWAYLPLLTGYGLFALCLLNIFGAFGFSRDTWLCCLLLAVGGMSQAAMGFTPSAGVSGQRTGIYFSFCIVGAAMLLARHLDWSSVRKQRLLWLVTGALCLLQLYSLWEI